MLGVQLDQRVAHQLDVVGIDEHGGGEGLGEPAERAPHDLEHQPRLDLERPAEHLGGDLQGKVDAIPTALAAYSLELSDEGRELIYTYDTKSERSGITSLLSDLRDAGIRFYDLDTTQSSLEDIFVSLVRAS